MKRVKHLAFLLGALQAALSGQTISDGFEGASIDPAWIQSVQYGTLGLSTEQAHSGAQSIKMSSTNGGQRSMLLQRNLGAPTKGKFSIYFYDASPGQQTLYQYFSLRNSAYPDMAASVGIADFDGNCYHASLIVSVSTGYGPSAACGGTGHYAVTNVARTAGWHKAEMEVLENSVEFRIDGSTVFSQAGDFEFDSVDYVMFGPAWRPNNVTYIDDFSFTAPGPLYQVCPLYDTNREVRRGIPIPIRLQLCDSAGTNLSSASLTLHATQLIHVQSGTPATIEDAANINPNNDFRFVPAIFGDNERYLFVLKTTALSSGTYRFYFVVTGSAATYHTDFRIR